MTDPTAFSWAAWGATAIAVGAVWQAVLAVLDRTGTARKAESWMYAYAWGAVMTGAILVAVSAWHFA